MKKTNFFTKMFWILALLAASSLVLTSCDGDDHDPNNNGGGNGGNLSPTTDPGVVYNGIRWATRNVDRPGTFAANPQDAGMFYQWDRRVGWSSTDPLVNSNGGTTWDSSIPDGTTFEWESANCPCPPGWRVPTIEELASLPISTWVTNWNNTGVNGSVFGTAPNQFFLPATGWRRNTNGALNGAGTHGNYWSSDYWDGGLYLMFVYGDDGILGFSGINHAFGLSVRCVSDN